MTRRARDTHPPTPPRVPLESGRGAGPLFASRPTDPTADLSADRRQRIESALADYLKANRPAANPDPWGGVCKIPNLTSGDRLPRVPTRPFPRRTADSDFGAMER